MVQFLCCIYHIYFISLWFYAWIGVGVLRSCEHIPGTPLNFIGENSLYPYCYWYNVSNCASGCWDLMEEVCYFRFIAQVSWSRRKCMVQSLMVNLLILVLFSLLIINYWLLKLECLLGETGIETCCTRYSVTYCEPVNLIDVGFGNVFVFYIGWLLVKSDTYQILCWTFMECNRHESDASRTIIRHLN